MNVIDTITSAFAPNSTDNVSPARIERAAEDLEHGTDLSWHEAAVLVGDELGATNRTIGRIIGRGDATITEIRYDVRQKRRDLEDEQDTVERTLDILREE